MTGQVRWARIKSTAVRDPDGGVRLAINLIEDITELKRSEESQRFLAEASRRLAGSLDYARTLESVAELAVPAIADECSLVLADRDFEPPPDALAVMRSGDGVARGAPDDRADDGRGAGDRDDHAGRPSSASTTTPTCWWPRTSGCARAPRSRTRGSTGRRRRSLRRCRPRCCRRTCRRSRARCWPPRITRRAQGLEVGGDFYDVFSTAEGQWYLVIGDVCGKGAEAAAVTALARYTLRTAAARRRSPASILRWVGEAMLHQDAAGGRFCTIACAHVDLARSPARVDGVVRRASAAGPAAGVRVRSRCSARRERCSGSRRIRSCRSARTELHPGDALVLYTDGLTEARAPSGMWGEAELLAAVRAAPTNGPAGLVESLVASALGGRSAPRDDLAVLALKLT